MNPVVLAVGALVGVAAWSGWINGGGEDDTSVLDPITDYMDTWDMTNEEALQRGNVQAFLGLIRQGEGTADAGGYSRLVGGGAFYSYADHPRQAVTLKRLGITSTAAGAYQILSRTWDLVRRQAGLSDFSPGSQDLAAVQLIRNRGALSDVLKGNLSAALAKCSYEWASLPPWRYSGQGTMDSGRAAQVFSDLGGVSYVG